MLLEDYDLANEEAKRLVYVAITRAKNNLTIHTNRNIFEAIEVPGLLKIHSTNAYVRPNNLLIRTSLKDVHLGFFRKNQLLIRKLSAGMELGPTAKGLWFSDRLVVTYSKSFADQLSQKAQKGYHVKKAVISHLVYWKDLKNKPKEYHEIIGGEIVSTSEILVVLVEIWLENKN